MFIIDSQVFDWNLVLVLVVVRVCVVLPVHLALMRCSSVCLTRALVDLRPTYTLGERGVRAYLYSHTTFEYLISFRTECIRVNERTLFHHKIIGLHLSRRVHHMIKQRPEA